MPHPLNAAQRQAVEHQVGPVVVLAGAGSGKTRVITHRIARLVERGVPAGSILALTFTNKAAGEMASRVSRLLDRASTATSHRRGGAAKRASSTERTGAVTVTTFHSFGLGVLKREQAATGGVFTIFDHGDSLAAI